MIQYDIHDVYLHNLFVLSALNYINKEQSKNLYCSYIRSLLKQHLLPLVLYKLLDISTLYIW